MSITAKQMAAWEAEVLYWKGRFQETDTRNAKLVAALTAAAGFIELRMPDPDGSFIMTYIREALAQQSTEKPLTPPAD